MMPTSRLLPQVAGSQLMNHPPGRSSLHLRTFQPFTKMPDSHDLNQPLVSIRTMWYTTHLSLSL